MFYTYYNILRPRLSSGAIYRTIQFITIFLGFNLSLAFSAPVSFGFGAGRFTKEVESFQDIKKRHIVSQSWDYSCGPAAIATILSYYFDEKISEEEILKCLLLTTNLKKVKKNKGFSLLDLKNFAKAKGYSAIGYKMDLPFLVSLNKPVLIPINIREYSHFVVFRGLSRDRVFLADPVLGHLTMRADRFIKIWQGGIGLVLSKTCNINHKSPLMLSEEEESFFTDSSYVQRILGENALGRIFMDGEF